jgi:Phage T7 tail fibre protein./Domain of unknown function (DUF1983).
MSTFIQYPGDGSTRDFAIPFSYLNPTHVQVKINDIVQVNGADYDFTGISTIQFRQYHVPVGGTVVEIRRVTPVDSLLVMFQNSAVLTADDLNTATQQLFYLAQEIRDIHEARIEGGLSRISNGGLTNAEDMIDAITQDILNSTLLADLQSRISDIDANAEAIIQQTLRLDDIDAQIVTEQTTRIDGDTALAETLALLGAKSGDNTAFILNTNTVKVSPTESLATRLSALTAADGANSAAIVTEQNARVSGDNANASSITSLQTTVNGHTTSISTLSSVQADIGAEFLVKTDVNGYVSGFGLYNTGATSDFIVLANRFAVVTPGNTPRVPFAVVGGTVFMQNVVIDGALIDDLSVGTIKIASGSITNAEYDNSLSTLIVPTFNAWINMGVLMSITCLSGSKVILWGGLSCAQIPVGAVVSSRIIRTSDNAVVGGGHVFTATTNNTACTLALFGMDTTTSAGSKGYRMQIFVDTAASPGVMTTVRSDLMALECKR